MPSRFYGSAALWSPLQYFIAILAVIFVAEAGVMYLLPFLLPADVDTRAVPEMVWRENW